MDALVRQKYPKGHGAGDVTPDSQKYRRGQAPGLLELVPQNRPEGHGIGSVMPSSQNLPTGHGPGELDARPQKRDAGHVRHDVAETAPKSVL